MDGTVFRLLNEDSGLRTHETHYFTRVARNRLGDRRRSLHRSPFDRRSSCGATLRTVHDRCRHRARLPHRFFQERPLRRRRISFRPYPFHRVWRPRHGRHRERHGRRGRWREFDHLSESSARARNRATGDGASRRCRARDRLPAAAAGGYDSRRVIVGGRAKTYAPSPKRRACGRRSSIEKHTSSCSPTCTRATGGCFFSGGFSSIPR